MLAYEAHRRPLARPRATPDEITDELLAGSGTQLAAPAAHRIAHRDLRLANVFLAADGEVWIIDFGFSELAAVRPAAGHRRGRGHRLASMAVGAGASGRRGPRGRRRRRGGVPLDRLKPVALSGATRTALKERPGLLDRLKALVAPPT